MLKTTFDKHKEYWTNKSGIPSALVEHIPNLSGLQILDLGCAGGRLASSLVGAAEVYGLDYSAELLKQAQQKFPKIKFICGDFQSSQSWSTIPALDLIVSNCAIRKDYCPDFQAVAKNCFDKLKPGGTLVLRVESDSDLSDIYSKDVRTTLFYSKSDLLNHLSMFKTSIQDEVFRQKFSSIEYAEQFLARTQLPSAKITTLGITRRYCVIRAEKSFVL
jgi:trans-aconitate methyltransferase